MASAFIKYVTRACTGCGNCVEICPSYIATGDIKNSPMGRIYLLKQRADLEALYASFSLCSMCKRCAYFCPLGLDVAELTRQVRDVLTNKGRPIPYVLKIVQNFEKHGNNIGMPPRVIEMAAKSVLRKIEKERGETPRAYLCGEAGCTNVFTGEGKSPRGKVALLFPSSSDVFEFETALRGYVYLLNKLGFDVVISTKLTDTANYGYYLGTSHMIKIAEMYLSEISRIKPQVVVYGECGHGWHVFTTLVVPKSPAPILHIHQLLYRAYERGTLKIERVEVRRPVVYMDPCNYSRGAVPLVREPRELLKAAVGDYVEFWKNPRESLCCLGGGGLVAPDMLKTAVEYWKRAYPRLREIGTAVRPCATCKAQLKRVFAALGVEAEVTGVVELLYRAVK